MVVRACNEPIEAQGGDKRIQVSLAVRRIGPQEFDDVGRTWTAFVLVFFRRHDSERLADILLMDTDDLVARGLAVVAFDHDGDFLAIVRSRWRLPRQTA